MEKCKHEEKCKRDGGCYGDCEFYTYHDGLLRAAEICFDADKSTHPTDLGEAILKEANSGTSSENKPSMSEV